MNERPMTRGQQHRRAMRPAWRNQGFTLVELMVAMLLGLIVIGGVTSVFLAGQQTYRTNEALGDVEDGSRTAFEMLARGLRNAGMNSCDSTGNYPMANILNGGVTNWYADWGNALHGYDNTAAIDDPVLQALPATGAGSPVVGQSSVHIISSGNISATVQNQPSSVSANFKLNEKSTDLQTGDIIIVCSFNGANPHATIMQITDYKGANVTVVHNTGTGSPGNCTKVVGYPAPISCGSGTNPTAGVPYVFPPNSPISKLTAADWYIGNNPLGTGHYSLYRLAVVNTNATNGGVSLVSQEMVRNVTGMIILYNQGGNGFINAAGINTAGTGWANVDAAQVKLTVTSTNQHAGVNAAPITRVFTSTTAVRNRVP